MNESRSGRAAAWRISRDRQRRGFALCALVLGACGGDPLVGTWRTTVTAFRRPVVVDVTFATSNELTIVETSVADPSATINVGCVEVRRTTGVTWHDDSSMRLMIDTNFANDTLARMSCTNAADNQTAMPDTAPLQVIANGTYTFSIMNSTLTLTDSSGGAPLMLTRSN